MSGANSMLRQRGVTLIEIMIAMLLASIVSAFVLMITRAQLIAYEQTDQVARMQQNERAGVAFVESLVRRACGGIQQGLVQKGASLLNCVNVTELANGTDQIDLLYGTSPWSSIVKTTALVTNASPSVVVADASFFAVGDYVLVTDFNEAVLLQISAITITTSPQAKLSLGSATPTLPTDLTQATLNTSGYVMKAASYSIYLDTTSGSVTQNMLMLDPDGILGSDHNDAQPIVENIIDFQLAIGRDDNNDGTVTEVAGGAADEWYGNKTGELPMTVARWNNGVTAPLPRWLRMSMIFQTGNVYPGAAPALPVFEDRVAASLPTPKGGTPRYRPVRLTVAPRVWNVGN